jgi:serine phosphatase RsbU (regulator of sigma subunit)
MQQSVYSYNPKLQFDRNTDESKLKRFDMLIAEANLVREKDKINVRNLFHDFYHNKLNVGIGFQRAYGSILAGDYFDLIKLPDSSHLFVFTDVSGHGLPAYTTLIRLRSAISLAIKNLRKTYIENTRIDTAYLIQDIVEKFMNIMEDANTNDFAGVNFTVIIEEDKYFRLKFYNRGMLFPIIVRNEKNSVKLINLNNEHLDWTPNKSFLLGVEFSNLAGEEYNHTPECEFIFKKGDSILYYSDGIIEAYPDDAQENEFGEQRLEEVLIENAGLFPQLVIDDLIYTVYDYIGSPVQQKDDMTAIMIDYPMFGNK